MNNRLNELVASVEHQRIVAQSERKSIENTVKQIANAFRLDKRQRHTEESHDDTPVQD
ncbi:MAG: hypothetical protein SH821_03290 [Phototrophicales bacterium]|jgi:hypothetical protein|nr:hypothetical protein [Phototrophicales bacterium]